MENNIKKIVILGPESTGKSTLCAQLAEYYKTSWVKEYAREYLEENGSHYTFENLYDIAKGQLVGEVEATTKLQDHYNTKNNTALFIDTDLHVIKIWSEFVFNIHCKRKCIDQIN